MNISVMRFDPSIDTVPAFKDYEVPTKEYMTLLEALIYINENHEPLAFDYSCGGRTCGRCAMMLDGVPVAACIKVLSDTNHTVEPLKGYPVVRDLVVDKTRFYDRVSAFAARELAHTLTWEEVSEPVDLKVYENLSALERCARCGCCNVVCRGINEKTPDEYVGPAPMVALAMRFYDPYDDGDRVLQAVSAGLWNCIECGNCTSVCPAGEIDHLSYWADLRAAAKKRGLAAEMGSALSWGKK